MAWEKIPYSHISFHFKSDDFTQPMVLESAGDGVDLVPLKKWQRKHQIVNMKDVELEEKHYKKMMRIAGTLIGIRYAYHILFIWPLMEVFRGVFANFKKPIGVDGKESMHCLEFVYTLLVKGGVMEPIDKPFEYVTHQEVYHKFFPNPA